MLSIKTTKGYIPLENRDNFNIVYSYEGEQTLSFDVSCNDTFFSYLHVKGKLRYKDNRYNITKMNKRRSIASFQAELDLNEWKRNIYQDFKMNDALLSDVLLRIKPQDWTIEDVAASKQRCDISLSGVNAYDILMTCKKQYGIVFEYHIEDKRIKVIDPLVIQQRGLYLSEELNLDSVEYKGEYNVQVNRLYAYGKKTEVENEDGSQQITYVNFASINQGKEYVDCFDYIDDEIVCAYIQEDKCEDASELLTLAKHQVKQLAAPQQSWSCNVYDVSRCSDMYRCLDFHLYDKPVLITDGKSIVHQIVEYSEYPDQQHLNKVVLSTTFKKIQGEITTIKTNIKDIYNDQNVKEQILNELRRDVSRNSLRIENTYTKNEIDSIEESIIEQTNKTIDVSIAEVNKKIEVVDVNHIQISFYKDGSILNHEITSITLRACVLHNAKDITSTIPNISFTWVRKSKDSLEDEAWNTAHKFMKEVVLHSEDIAIAASFQLRVETATYIKESSFETIVDETDIPRLSLQFDSNLPMQQRYFPIAKTLYPSWNPLRITPVIRDGVLLIECSQCNISWKRNDAPLAEHETVDKGKLLVSKDILLETSNRMVTYVCDVEYKGQHISNQITYALLQDGEKGTDGDDGKDATTYYTWIKYADDNKGTGISDLPTDKQYIGIAYNKTVEEESDIPADYAWSLMKGNDGISIIAIEVLYYLSTSSTILSGGMWSTKMPSWREDCYIWSKQKTTLSNEEIKETTPICITGAKGEQGEAGASGKGISTICAQYYLSTSKLEQNEGDWNTIPPTWRKGLYMWTRSQIIYTDATITYTTPICDTSWEVVNDIEVGGRNLLRKSNYAVRNTSFPIQVYDFGDRKPNEEELVTIRLKGTLGSNKTKFAICNSGDLVSVVDIRAEDFKDGIATTTCKWIIDNGEHVASNTFISVYPMPSSEESESTIEWIKLETGNIPTAWTPAPEDFDSLIEESKTQITESYNAAIGIAKDAIDATVGKLQERVSETSKELESTVNSLKITSEDATFAKETITSLHNSLDGKVDVSTIKEWARFDGASLELGASNSPFKAVLSNTELAFTQGTMKVAWISNNELHIANSVIMEILKVGNWVCRDEGSAGLTWRRV